MPQDYIMRLIEQIGALLAGIIAKTRAGLHSEAKAEIDEKAQQTIGMDLRQVRAMSPEAVSQLLDGGGGLRQGRAMILVELLQHDAAVSEATGDNANALLDHLHAFCLLFDTIDTLTKEDQLGYRPKLDALAARLRDLPSHPYVTARLADYDERALRDRVRLGTK
jgi:hypothetical protein